MKSYGFLLLLLGALPAAAQQGGSQASSALTSGQPGADNLRALSNLGNFSTGLAFDNSYTTIRGTPYTVAKWLPGVVYMRRGVKATDAALKYDAYAQRLLALRPTKDSLIVDLSQVERFVLKEERLDGSGNKVTYERLYQRAPEAVVAIKEAFVEVLYASPTSKYALYKLPRKRLIKAEGNQRGFNTGRDYDQFLEASELYLRTPAGKLEKVKPSQKTLAAALTPAEAKRLDQLKLNIRTEQDLCTALAALDAKP